ncbi:torsin-1A-like [Mercenaria mercenaria]|uniref:torsin-1A-like n=1 Tax=Mercenaria mercenaria TaxID=6596 RepID=UPI00234E96D7|nr:torsin-1A-like [Mercenaria mercenaria]
MRKYSSNRNKTVEICICNTLWTLTSFCMVFLLSKFTSIFVCTLSSGLLLLLLFIAIVDNPSHGNDCLKQGILGSCLTVAGALGFGAIATGLQCGYTISTCYFNECCDYNWISPNITGLSLQLNKKLYGQHLVIGPVVKHLRGHVEGHPQKATVLSLHGLPGTGKNFLSRIVAENMYVKGMDSKYVHILSATKDFPHENMLEEYKEKLKLEIETAGKECPRSLFIVDEMDKLLPGLIDTIRPFIDYYDHVDGIDYRQFLFFFLSNTGGDAIAEHVLLNSEQGKDRRKLSLKEMEEVVRVASFNDTNGLMHSSIVKNSLITAYVPFLPLERVHVEKCIVDRLFAKGFYEYEYQVDQETVGAIANELLYFPIDTRLFSTTGCKRVMEKIDLIMQEDA